MSISKSRADYPNLFEKEVNRTILRKCIQCNSYSYLKFILELAKNNFIIPTTLTENEKLMVVMLHYDFWLTAGNFDSIETSIKKIGDNQILKQGIIETLEFLIDRISHKELDIDLPYPQPLKLHSRYTREQILAAFGASTFKKQSSNREGVVNLESKNTELLLVTLEKTEENYSPTTMYNDYAVSEKIFHWQSQNSAKPETGKGLSYIKHKENGKSILLFVREKNTDEFGNTMSYVFLGAANYLEHTGSKPMSIKWGLQVPIPPYIWKDTAKMAVG